MNRKIRLQLVDRSIFAAEVTSAFEAATDAEGHSWSGMGSARGHLWLLASGAIGRSQTSLVYATEL